jgi:hypothetical protein
MFIVVFCNSLFAATQTVRLGDTPVVIKHIKGQGKMFVHLHHNEYTALKAAKAVIKKEGGSLITLEHPGGRNIVFRMHHQRYEFDPNRIFSDVGIKKTLSRNGAYSLAAHREVKKLALKIKEYLPAGKVIAVHNNESYSLKDYLPGHGLAEDAKAVYMTPKQYFRNFFLVTRYKEFWRLKQKGFNGVLQQSNAMDDGSLSILLAKNNYINVEAGYTQLKAQIKMLRQA